MNTTKLFTKKQDSKVIAPTDIQRICFTMLNWFFCACGLGILFCYPHFPLNFLTIFKNPDNIQGWPTILIKAINIIYKQI